MSASSPHQARKRFGQNFLVDDNVIHQIIASIHPRQQDNMVEIGPGQGAITGPLLAALDRLNVVELDRDLIPRLELKFAHHNGLTIHSADALKFNFGQLATATAPLRIVGNLPYNISTPLIFHLLSYGNQIADMHFMLQKEVVERMAATAGNKNYGRLSIMCQYHCNVEFLFEVPPYCFSPAPKVDSAIVRLTPHKKLPVEAKDTAMLDKVVKTAFQQRRKTLRNSLKPIIEAMGGLETLNIDPNKRPENLTLEDYVNIANQLV